MAAELPTVDPALILAFLAGLFVPFEFAMTRIRGFGKFWVAKLPQYEPDEETASGGE
ncbi:hypothetical protein [Haloarchaeobius sp. DFWS5]|uniref:hypothetical protein n=1 Tax=Haloarchaeobius sp. DFWS5 TaxID=3446114 RepID=UPI003EBFD43F